MSVPQIEAFADSVVLAIQSAIGPLCERLAALEARFEPLNDVRDRLVAVELKAAIPPPTQPEIPHVDLTPVLERVAAAEVRLVDLPSFVQSVSELRDRVTVVETKSTTVSEHPPPRQEPAVPPIDLAPILERCARLEATVAAVPNPEPVLTELRDRIVTIETKTSVPVVVPSPVDLAPVLERLASAEARLSVLGDVRDRLVTVETKAAQPVPAPAVIEPPVPVDLSPVLERVAAAEARLDVLGDLRDRVVIVETKASQPIPIPAPAVLDLPAPVDLSPVLERLASTEARLHVLGDLRDRVITIETKAAQPLPPVDMGDVRERLTALEADLKDSSTRVAMLTREDVDPLRAKCDTLSTEVNALRERIAVAETRQLIPGPMGRDGQPGRDGKDGKDGVDGLGYDELGIEQLDDERSVKFKAMRGLQVRDLGTVTIPAQIYRGVYLEGKSYERGDGVTWGGSEWHCNEPTTTKPGDGSKAWTLIVKRGRDGKDGRDAPSLPVVSVGKR